MTTSQSKIQSIVEFLVNQINRIYKMANSLEGYTQFKHFLVSSPAEYVAHVETNRPNKLNAFYHDMWVELGQIFNQFSNDPNVRAVVFSAVGDRAFTAGLDIQSSMQGGMLKREETTDGARFATRVRRHVLEFQDCVSAIEKCEKRMSFFIIPFCQI